MELGGSERIRTAVKGFADLCLATRPRNLVFTKLEKMVKPILLIGLTFILILRLLLCLLP